MRVMRVTIRVMRVRFRSSLEYQGTRVEKRIVGAGELTRTFFETLNLKEGDS
jgi:hypothetical protein